MNATMKLTLNQRIALFDLAANRGPEAARITLLSLYDRGLICSGPKYTWVLTAAGLTALDQQRRLAARAARRAERSARP